MIEEKLYNYVTMMWYESNCKDHKEIKRIISEEIQDNPNKTYLDLRLPVLRRCKREL